MKKSEIVEGCMYCSGGPRAPMRVVTGFKNGQLYPGQMDTDLVEYKTVDPKTLVVGKSGSMTRTAFANWAKNIVVNT